MKKPFSINEKGDVTCTVEVVAETTEKQRLFIEALKNLFEDEQFQRDLARVKSEVAENELRNDKTK